MHKLTLRFRILCTLISVFRVTLFTFSTTPACNSLTVLKFLLNTLFLRWLNKKKSNEVRLGDQLGNISLVINLFEKNCSRYSIVAQAGWAGAESC